MVNPEKILAETMDQLPELEGIILNQGSKVIAAQTIFEDINDQEAAKQAIQAASAAANLSQTLGKGALEEIIIIFEDKKGLAIVMGQEDFILTGIAGEDANLGVLRFNLRKCLTKLLE